VARTKLKPTPPRVNTTKERVVLKGPDNGKLSVPQAAHRNVPVHCPVCDRTVQRKSRNQQFCSTRCRQQAHYEKSVAEGRFDPVLGGQAALPTSTPKKSNGTNGLQAAKSRSTSCICGPRDVIEVELFAGRDWTPAVSPDGVVCMVAARLRGRPQ
jgi:hypothetical protein